MVVRAALGATALACLIAFPFSTVVAHGIALGGIGGTVVFWILARRLEKVATSPPEKVKFLSIRATLLRLGVYALVLYKAYTLDPVAGLLSALGGLFIIRAVVIFFAFTEYDLKQEER